MAYEVVMPRLGWNMESGSLGEWLKQDGEHVEQGEPLFTVEGDKAVQEIEALESGILRIPPDSPGPGKDVPVGTLLAYVVKPGEAAPFASQATPEPDALPQATHAQTAPPPAQPLVSGLHPPASPRARRVAKELGVEWTRLQGSGSGGRIVERDVRQAAPLPSTSATPAPMPSGAALPIGSARLASSAHSTAAITLTTEADATELVQVRKQVQGDHRTIVPSYNDFLAKIAAAALMEQPALNAPLEGDTIVPAATADIGITVDTEHGLLAPVLRDVQTKSLRQIARESAALIEKAHSGGIGPDDIHGGAFTITNLGMYEIDAFTPIINPPQCAVLGVGRIVPKQVVLDVDSGLVAIRRMVFLSLTFDHRLADAATAARFLQRVKQYVETPYLWLL